MSKKKNEGLQRKPKYYVVSSEILPDVLEKVLECQHLLMTGKIRKISEAVKVVDISRGTYYKYKDAVFAFHEENSRRKAIVTMIVRDEKGVLSEILALIADHDVNVLALNQTIPINHITTVTATLDIGDLEDSIQDLIRYLEEIQGVESCQLVAVE